MEESEHVALGCISKKSKTHKLPAYKSGVGGIPWLLADIDGETLLCNSCGKQRQFVMQIYAPVDADRYLYVFACTSPKCSRTSTGWYVLRQQAVGASAEAAAVPDKPAQESSSWTTPLTNASSSSWGTSGGWGAGGGWTDDGPVAPKAAEAAVDVTDGWGSTGGWGAEGAEADAVSDQLAAVSLSTNDNDSRSKTELGHEHNVVATWPAYVLYEVDEVIAEAPMRTKLAHEKAMYERYLAADEGIAEAVAAAEGDSSVKASDGGGGGGGGGERYEKTPAKLKYLLQYQERMAQYPEQVVRYSWCGSPVWPVPPPTRHDQTVPACCCGAKRRFEAQIVSNVLQYIDNDDILCAGVSSDTPTCAGGAEPAGQPLLTSTPATAPQTTPAERGSAPAPAPGPTTSILDEGIDFASILVYSCEASCSESSSEWTFVIPPV